MGVEWESALPRIMHTAIILALAVLAFFVAVLLMYVGGNWLTARFRKPKPPPRESIERYLQRLLNPRWDELRDYFGQTVPRPLANLYDQKELIIRHDVIFSETPNKEWHVAGFYPADKGTLDAIWPELKKSKAFPFAFDSVGDCYFVAAGNESSGCPVMYYHHDGGGVELVSKSLDEFIGWKTGH
jgi:hypothetical protein